MAATETALNQLPGDRRDSVASMLRVDHAGEFGAARIYAGQLAVLGNRHPAAAGPGGGPVVGARTDLPGLDDPAAHGGRGPA